MSLDLDSCVESLKSEIYYSVEMNTDPDFEVCKKIICDEYVDLLADEIESANSEADQQHKQLSLAYLAQYFSTKNPLSLEAAEEYNNLIVDSVVKGILDSLVIDAEMTLEDEWDSSDQLRMDWERTEINSLQAI